MAVTDQPAFPFQQFHDLLLDGTRRSFQYLNRHYHDEHIYRTRDGSRFVERGAAFFDPLNSLSTQQRLTRRLERLGFRGSWNRSNRRPKVCFQG
jgi:hypothetical protein